MADPTTGKPISQPLRGVIMKRKKESLDGGVEAGLYYSTTGVSRMSKQDKNKPSFSKFGKDFQEVAMPTYFG